MGTYKKRRQRVSLWQCVCEMTWGLTQNNNRGFRPGRIKVKVTGKKEVNRGCFRGREEAENKSRAPPRQRMQPCVCSTPLELC
jgi:hypothetical protein